MSFHEEIKLARGQENAVKLAESTPSPRLNSQHCIKRLWWYRPISLGSRGSVCGGGIRISRSSMTIQQIQGHPGLHKTMPPKEREWKGKRIKCKQNKQFLALFCKMVAGKMLSVGRSRPEFAHRLECHGEQKGPGPGASSCQLTGWRSELWTL